MVVDLGKAKLVTEHTLQLISQDEKSATGFNRLVAELLKLRADLGVTNADIEVELMDSGSTWSHQYLSCEEWAPVEYGVVEVRACVHADEMLQCIHRWADYRDMDYRTVALRVSSVTWTERCCVDDADDVMWLLESDHPMSNRSIRERNSK